MCKYSTLFWCFVFLLYCCIKSKQLSVLQMILEKKSKSLPKEQVQRENVQLSQSEPSTLLPGFSSVTAPTRKGQQEPTPPLVNPSHVHAGATAGVQPAGSSQSKDLARNVCQRSQISVMMYNPITHTTVQSGYHPPTPWGIVGREDECCESNEGNLHGKRRGWKCGREMTQEQNTVEWVLSMGLSLPQSMCSVFFWFSYFISCFSFCRKCKSWCWDQELFCTTSTVQNLQQWETRETKHMARHSALSYKCAEP